MIEAVVKFAIELNDQPKPLVQKESDIQGFLTEVKE